MVPSLRARFNREYSPERYASFLRDLNAVCGTPLEFRVCETPCFIPYALLAKMCEYGRELVDQLVNNSEYLRISDAAVPPNYNVANEAAQPMFVQVDFGLVCESNGELQPKLVELQGFPSLYGYQPALARQYVDSYGLDRDLNIFFGALDESSYWKLLHRLIVADSNPENVVLLEIDPFEQKTLPDFLITQKHLGIAIINIRDLVKQGKRLFYPNGQKLIPVERIYNRCIVDELARKGVTLPFDVRDELAVGWAGHPNWYFRLSKFSIPYLRHHTVPKTFFLDEIEELPNDRENYLLKPLYAFAGAGIRFAPTDDEIAAIPPEHRHDYIVQERISFTPVIRTPHGDTKVEVRIMYVWPEGGELTPVLPLLRMGRGKMMGVDHNRNMEWVGSSAGLLAPEESSRSH
jgi:hypothetical protein